MAGVKFVYFNLRARGETSRLVLAKSGQKWEDVEIPFDKWPEYKAGTPFGTLPYIEYKGKKYGQSLAIDFFLAQECGLAGKTNLDGLRCQEVTHFKEDFIQIMAKQKFNPDDKVKEETKKKMIEEDIPRILGYFENMLKENGGKGFFVGSALTVADLAVYDLCDTLLVYNPKSLDAFPEVQKLRKVVEADKEIKAYLAGKKKPDF